jgi:hypothetical protein
MKGRHAHEKTTEKNKRQITGMGCSAATRPCRRRQMSCPQEEAAPPRLVSGPVAWRPPSVMARALPSGRPPAVMEASAPRGLPLRGPKFPVPTLVQRLLLVGLLLLGLSLVGGDEHPVTRRETAGVERLCCPGSLGGTGGRPCRDAGRIPGSAPVQGLFSTRILGQRWNRLEIGVVVANFDWLPDHPSEIGRREAGPEATGWPESWEEPKGLGVKQMSNCVKVLGCSRVRALSSPAPPFCWQGTQQGAGEKREFESTAPGTRTRWPKRRRIAVREQAGDGGPGGAGLAGRLTHVSTSLIVGASPG